MRMRTRRVAAMAAASLVVAGAASACTNQVSTTTPSASGSTAVVGDQLTMGVPAPATGMNPATVSSAFGFYAWLSYEPLIRFAPGGTYQPALATAWTIAPGNESATLTLRQGVTFSDGTPVTAQAVKASLDYCASSASANAQTMPNLSSVDVVDATHVKITLSQPNPLFENMLSQQQGCGMIISPAGLKNIANLTVDTPSAGAGEYVYQPSQSVPGSTYTYTANPKYYDPARQHFKKIVLKVFTQPQAALNALSTGQIDITMGDASTAAQAVKDNFQVAWTPFVWMGLNLIDRNGQTTKAMGDVRVRQAINYAINRDAIAKALLGEFGVATDQPSAKGFDGWSDAAGQVYPYDVAKAKQLMAQAGYAGGFDLPVLTVAFGGQNTLATALQPMLAAIGVRMKITTVTDEKSYFGGLTNKKYSAVTVGYGSQPMALMGSSMALPNALPWNGFGTNDPTAVGMLKSIETASSAERGQDAQALNLYLVKQAWFAPVLFAPVLFYARTGLQGVSVDGSYPVISPLDLSTTS